MRIHLQPAPSAGQVFKPLEMEEKETPKNDCYECPHRREVPGSAHSACELGKPMQAPFLLAYSMGKTPKLTNKETGEVILEIHPHGARSGWAMWPMNFDPVWITCRFPISKTEG